jgi:hypothetical protein
MSNVTFVDVSDAFRQKLNRKLLECVRAAAVTLADGFQTGLQANKAPPHSKPGQIPHAYAPDPPKNTPLSGFARIQRPKDYLSNYIEGEASGLFGSIDGVVGFRSSHVTTRRVNYLLNYDISNNRPWVMRLYRRNRKSMAKSAMIAFREAK